MKRILLYIILFILLCFILPILLTKNSIQKVSKEIENQDTQITESTYDYKDMQTIKLLHTKTGEIEELNLDEYLYGVVSAEMPANFEKEALKAQAVVARTYTIYKIKTEDKKHRRSRYL